MSQLHNLIEKLRIIEESAEQLNEDAEHVSGIIAAAINAGKSISGTTIAKGIADPEQQISKVAGIIATLWNIVALKARDPNGTMDAATVAKMLKTMDVRSQDEASATLIDAFGPSGDATKEKWVKALSMYEQALQAGDQQRIQAIKNKILPIINKITSDIRIVTATGLKQPQQQPNSNTPHFA